MVGYWYVLLISSCLSKYFVRGDFRFSGDRNLKDFNRIYLISKPPRTGVEKILNVIAGQKPPHVFQTKKNVELLAIIWTGADDKAEDRLPWSGTPQLM